MQMLKWDFSTKQYAPYTIPEGWYVPLYTDNMDEEINCASCGKDMVYGAGLTSRAIHNRVGFGFPVCEQCYEKELESEKKHAR